MRERGIRVSGSDAFQFPPMPEILRGAGIRVHRKWSEKNLPRKVDAVIAGALVFRGNPELEAALDRRLPLWNSAAFLEQHLLRYTENFVVAGTKGKTTTTAMLAWILEKTGHAPGFLIGGQVRGPLPRVRLPRGPCMVLEGDEYQCGFGDPLSKFLRYHPRHLVLTNVSHDHHEMFPTVEGYQKAFHQLVQLVPRAGSITLCADDPVLASLTHGTPAVLHSVGFSPRARHRITRFRQLGEMTTFSVGGVTFQLLLAGRMNAVNAALAAVAANGAGVSLKKASAALRDFPGVEGRQEIVAQSAHVILYADDAGHPTAMKPLLEALRLRHPRRRLTLIYEPRNTDGSHGYWQHSLPESLASADTVLVCPPVEICNFSKPFDPRLLCRQLRARGVSARAVSSLSEIPERLPQPCPQGDVFILCFVMGREEIIQKIARTLCPTPSIAPRDDDS